MKLSCYYDNYFKYFMFGKYNGFVSKASVSTCMYFLLCALISLNFSSIICLQEDFWKPFCFESSTSYCSEQ